MKKLMIMLMAVFATVAAQAYDYPYLTFENADGTQSSVSVESLTLTVSDGQIVAVGADGTQTYPLASLSKMFFSKEAAQPTGIASINTVADSPVEVFSVAGVSLGTFQSASEAQCRLKPGVYVVKQGKLTIKTVVR